MHTRGSSNILNIRVIMSIDASSSKESSEHCLTAWLSINFNKLESKLSMTYFKPLFLYKGRLFLDFHYGSTFPMSMKVTHQAQSDRLLTHLWHRSIGGTPHSVKMHSWSKLALSLCCPVMQIASNDTQVGICMPALGPVIHCPAGPPGPGARGHHGHSVVVRHCMVKSVCMSLLELCGRINCS